MGERFFTLARREAERESPSLLDSSISLAARPTISSSRRWRLCTPRSPTLVVEGSGEEVDVRELDGHWKAAGGEEVRAERFEREKWPCKETKQEGRLSEERRRIGRKQGMIERRDAWALWARWEGSVSNMRPLGQVRRNARMRRE